MMARVRYVRIRLNTLEDFLLIIYDQQNNFYYNYLNNYFNFHVCLSFLCPCVHPCVRVCIRASENLLLFLQVYNKTSLIKDAWYVSWVKNMHFWSPSDPIQTAAAKEKPRYIYLILKPHDQSFRRQVRLLLSKAQPSYVYSILKPHTQSSRSPVRPLLARQSRAAYTRF